MPESMRCVPGEPNTPGGKVTLTRTGTFPVGQGTVKLIAAGDDATMEIIAWTPTAIEAVIPEESPGSPPFYVEVTAEGQTFKGPIDVRSENGDGGYPPMR